MPSNALLFALGLILATRTGAAPLSELGPGIRPLSTIVSSVPTATATEVAYVTAGEASNHEHRPNCEHSHNVRNFTSGPNGPPSEGDGHVAKVMSDPTPYPGFNANANSHPHTGRAHNHTGKYCDHPSHHNTTTTDATYDSIIHPRLLTVRADSLHNHNHTKIHCGHPSHHNRTSTHHGHEHKGTRNHTEYSCTDASHHNRTAAAEQSHNFEKRTVVPRVDATVCRGANCKDSTVVTADLSSAGELEMGTHDKDGKRTAKRQNGETSYQDIARQMSGGGIAGGI